MPPDLRRLPLLPYSLSLSVSWFLVAGDAEEALTEVLVQDLQSLRRLSSLRHLDSARGDLHRAAFHWFASSLLPSHTTVFDREQGDTALYRQIHVEFAHLVDTLIECFCSDSHIRPDQLVEALNEVERERLSLRQRVRVSSCEESAGGHRARGCGSGL